MSILLGDLISFSVGKLFQKQKPFKPFWDDCFSKSSAGLFSCLFELFFCPLNPNSFVYH